MQLVNRNKVRWQAIIDAVVVLLVALIAAPQARGQSTSGAASGNRAAVALSATLPAQLRLSLSTVNLDIEVSDPTQSSATITVPVTSSWVLDAASNNVQLVGYFDSPAAAMSDSAGHVIPASHVLGGLTEENMMPFTESSSVGTPNASRTLFSQPISRGNFAATRTDTLQIKLNRIDDLGAPAADYRGVLHLRLVAF